MAKRILVVVLLVAAAVGGWKYYEHWTSPEQVARRLSDAVDREAERIVQALPEAIASGPGVDRLDPTSIVRRVVFTAAGARVELDAGPARVLGARELVHFVERDGEDGRQPGDGVTGRFSHRQPEDLRRGKRTGWLQSTDGYGPKVSLEDRRSIEVSAQALEPETAAATRAAETLGPAIDLAAAPAPAWRLLWRREGGETLHWRNVDGATLQLRCRGVAGEPPPPEVVLEPAGKAWPLAVDADAFLVSLPFDELESLTGGVRCTIRVGEHRAIRIVLRPAP